MTGRISGPFVQTDEVKHGALPEIKSNHVEKGRQELILTATDGTWEHGKACITTLDSAWPSGAQPLSKELAGLQVVQVMPLRRYSLARHGREGARALRALAENSSEDAIIDFANRYGPLLDFWRWARLGAPIFSAEERKQLEGSDAPAFADWCGIRGDEKSQLYVHLAWGFIVAEGGAIRPEQQFILPEPVALYVWAAQHLSQLEQQLRDGKLTDDVESWMRARLDESRLYFRPDGQRLVPRATTLLSYLAMQTVWDLGGWRPETRSCQECGTAFIVKHGRQRFCTTACQERNKKRRQRRQQLRP